MSIHFFIYTLRFPFLYILAVAVLPFRAAKSSAAFVDNPQRYSPDREIFLLKLSAKIHIIEMKFETLIEFNSVIYQS